MKLLFTPEAERQASEMDAWWREHRLGASDLFARELAQVGDLIAVNPNVGVTYATSSGRITKRVLMPRTRNHVYFAVDEDQNRVVVLAVWGAPRGQGPAL